MSQNKKVAIPSVTVDPVIPPNQIYYVIGQVRIRQHNKDITSFCKGFKSIDALKAQGKKDADQVIKRKTKQDRFIRYFDEEKVYIRAEGAKTKQVKLIKSIEEHVGKKVNGKKQRAEAFAL